MFRWKELKRKKIKVGKGTGTGKARKRMNGKKKSETESQQNSRISILGARFHEVGCCEASLRMVLGRINEEEKRRCTDILQRSRRPILLGGFPPKDYCSNACWTEG